MTPSEIRAKLENSEYMTFPYIENNIPKHGVLSLGDFILTLLAVLLLFSSLRLKNIVNVSSQSESIKQSVYPQLWYTSTTDRYTTKRVSRSSTRVND